LGGRYDLSDILGQFASDDVSGRQGHTPGAADRQTDAAFA
jgi:hypothetical protein